jgi:hypothetical protein
MVQIGELSAESTPQALNQATRWVMTKEDHASQIIETVSSYMLAQRVKPELFDTTDGAPADMGVADREGERGLKCAGHLARLLHLHHSRPRRPSRPAAPSAAAHPADAMYIPAGYKDALVVHHKVMAAAVKTKQVGPDLSLCLAPVLHLSVFFLLCLSCSISLALLLLCQLQLRQGRRQVIDADACDALDAAIAELSPMYKK